MVAMDNRASGTRADGQASRYAVNLSATYFHIDWQACEIIDVSSSGATIRTRQILVRRDRIVLQLSHGGRSASLMADVLHQSGMRACLVFDGAGAEQKARFLELIRGALLAKAKDRIKLVGMDA